MTLKLDEKLARVRPGTTQIRPASQSDAEAMSAMFSRLSRETLYLRFHIPYRSVPGWAMKTFLGDGFDGECIVAVEGERIVGHAMYATVSDGREAEVALVVEDESQSRGVGKHLLRELALRGEGRGIEIFYCRSLWENRRVAGLVRAVFREASERAGDGVRITRAPLRSLRSEGSR